MTTFSALVDSIVNERKRPDMIVPIASYVNATVRELHTRSNTGDPIRYDNNRVETELTLAGTAPFMWAIPNITRFAQIEAVYNDTQGWYLPEKTPSRNHAGKAFEPWENRYWYRSGTDIIFSGVQEGDNIKLSYHTYLRSLAYKSVADRIVIFNMENETYLRADDSAPTEDELNAETHWALQRWASVIAEGTRSKLFRNLGDVERARFSYSAYEQARTAMLMAEPSTTS